MLFIECLSCAEHSKCFIILFSPHSNTEVSNFISVFQQRKWGSKVEVMVYLFPVLPTVIVGHLGE